jgi:ribosomal protein L9
MLFQLYAPDLAEPNFDVPLNGNEGESGNGAVEHPDDELLANSVEMDKGDAASLAAKDRVKSMAAIIEASPPSRRSKRRADTADQANLERAEKLKAAQNLDPSPKQGTIESSDKSFLNYSSAQVADNLNTIGICLGKDNLEIDKDLKFLKMIEVEKSVPRLIIFLI